MRDFDLGKLTALVERLDKGIPTRPNIFRGVPNMSETYVDRDADSADRAEAAAAIRALVAENARLTAEVAATLENIVTQLETKFSV